MLIRASRSISGWAYMLSGKLPHWNNSGFQRELAVTMFAKFFLHPYYWVGDYFVNTCKS
jgi:hypothetical protein